MVAGSRLRLWMQSAALLCFGLVSSVATASLIERDSPDRFFRVYGEMGGSVGSVSEIAAAAEQWIQRSLRDRRPSNPVLVELVPVPGGDAPDPSFAVERFATARLRVQIAWNDQTQLAEVCQALASGWLRQRAILLGSPPPPIWVELAAGAGVFHYLMPATLDAAAEQARQTGPWPVRKVINATDPFPEGLAETRLQAFWVVETLQRSLPRPGQVPRLWAALLEGQPPEVARARAEESTDPAARAAVLSDSTSGSSRWPLQPAAFEQAYAAAFTSQVFGRQPPVKTVTDSANLLRRLATIVVELPEGGEQRLLGSQFWQFRREPTVEAALRQRLRLVKLEALAANPIYRNAFLELGLTYQAALNGDSVSFDRHLSAFFTEARLAHDLANALAAIPDW